MMNIFAIPSMTYNTIPSPHTGQCVKEWGKSESPVECSAHSCYPPAEKSYSAFRVLAVNLPKDDAVALFECRSKDEQWVDHILRENDGWSDWRPTFFLRPSIKERLVSGEDSVLVGGRITSVEYRLSVEPERVAS